MNHRMSHRVVILDRVQSECYNLSPAPRCTSSSLADLATTYKPTRPATGRANHYLVVRATLSYGMQFCTNLSESDVNSSSSLDQKKTRLFSFFSFQIQSIKPKIEKANCLSTASPTKHLFLMSFHSPADTAGIAARECANVHSLPATATATAALQFLLSMYFQLFSHFSILIRKSRAIERRFTRKPF